MAGEFLPPVVTRLEADIGDLVTKVQQAKALIKSLGTDANVSLNIKTDGIGAAAAKVTALGAASKAAGAATGASIPVWHRWLDLIHFGFAILGENLVADTIGIAAFAASAVNNLGPAFEAVSNLGKTFGYLNNQQKAAAEAITLLKDKFQGAVNTGVFAVFYGMINLINGVLQRSGGVTQQATQAFEYFAAILQRDFASPQWADIFGRSSSLVKTDLEALMRLLDAFIQLIPGLLHDFNGMGLGFLGAATLILRGLGYISEAYPNLTRFAYAAYLAERAWKYLWVGMGAGAGPLQRAAIAIKTFFAAMAGGSAATGAAAEMKLLGISVAGVSQNLRQFGLLPTIGFITGLGASSLIAVGAVGLLAAGFVALYFATKNYNDAVGNTISSVSAMDQTNQNSLPTWERGLELLQQQAKAVDNNASSYKAFNQVQGVASRYIQPYNADLARVTDAMQTQSQGVTNLKNNFGYLQQVYHLSAAGAAQLATQLGLSMNKAFGPNERTMIANYEQAVAAAKNPLTAVQYGMKVAADSALQLDDRVTALGNAFNALLTPFANVLQDQVNWKQSLDTLKTDLQQSNGVVNAFGNAAQNASAGALASMIQSTIKLSQDTLNSSGSMTKALGPVQQLENYLKSLGDKSGTVAAAIKILQQYIDSLHSKVVDIWVNYHQSGAVAGSQGAGGSGNPAGGLATGTMNAAAGWTIVGERGPELLHLRGGEQVVSHNETRGILAGGGGGGGDIQVKVYLDGNELRRSLAQATWADNFRNGNRMPDGRPSGVMRPR